jgi:hypothetical protein
MFNDGRNRPAQPGRAHESRRVQQIRDAGGNEMTISTIDESPRKAAKVAGFAYLIMFATVVVNPRSSACREQIRTELIGRTLI